MYFAWLFSYSDSLYYEYNSYVLFTTQTTFLMKFLIQHRCITEYLEVTA